MGAGFEALSNSRIGQGVALGVGRALPQRAGHGVVSLVARRLSTDRESGMYRAFASNRWVLEGGGMTAQELDSAVRETITTVGTGLFDLYRAMAIGSDWQSQVRLTPLAAEYAAQQAGGEHPYMLAGPHTAGFDIGIRGVALAGLKMQVLSVPDPNAGYEWQNARRAEAGLEVTPISGASMRAALCRLKEGKSVATGLDRPVPGEKHRVRMFGREAALPTIHVRLALKAKVPVVLLCVLCADDGVYEVHASPPIEMVFTGGDDVVENAERVMRIAEDFLRRAPHQWAMPHVIWPDAVDELPR
ncbi:MAG: lysophospholipid acyltransferase family protein [Actinomycetota bacterium]|nr:lysophospholipid acyltransferase family protein [Actinomycetota bacterium]